MRIHTLAAAVVGLGLALAPLPATAASANSSFTIDTQNVGGASDIVAATGAFASCTEATDLSGFGNQIKPRKVQFSGEKLLTCGDSWVIVHYDATLNFSNGKRTFGTWFIVDSTLEGATSGGGRLAGDSTACVPVVDFCILDHFWGKVS